MADPEEDWELLDIGAPAATWPYLSVNSMSLMSFRRDQPTWGEKIRLHFTTGLSQALGYDMARGRGDNLQRAMLAYPRPFCVLNLRTWPAEIRRRNYDWLQFRDIYCKTFNGTLEDFNHTEHSTLMPPMARVYHDIFVNYVAWIKDPRRPDDYALSYICFDATQRKWIAALAQTIQFRCYGRKTGSEIENDLLKAYGYYGKPVSDSDLVSMVTGLLKLPTQGSAGLPPHPCAFCVHKYPQRPASDFMHWRKACPHATSEKKKPSGNGAPGQ
jgi:hypothetical protein